MSFGSPYGCSIEVAIELTEPICWALERLASYEFKFDLFCTFYECAFSFCILNACSYLQYLWVALTDLHVLFFIFKLISIFVICSLACFQSHCVVMSKGLWLAAMVMHKWWLLKLS